MVRALFLGLAIWSGPVGACDMIVVVWRAEQVRGTAPCNVHVFAMDRIRHVTRQLQQELPQDLQAAQQWVEKNRETLEQRIKAAYFPYMLMAQHKITNLPAIIVNDQMLITDTNNIGQAYEIYKEHQP